MFKNKNKNKSKLLVLSCLVSTPVTAIHSAAPQTDDLFFLLLPSQACPSPPFSLLSYVKLLFSYSVPLGSNVWACRKAQCASVQDMRGRAIKHSPSPHRVHCFAEPGKKEGRHSRRGVVTCMCYHLTPSFAEDKSPTP